MNIHGPKIWPEVASKRERRITERRIAERRMTVLGRALREARAINHVKIP